MAASATDSAEERGVGADEVLACQFGEWFPAVRRHTIRSEVIELPEDFVAFLNEDGVVLPPELATTQPKSRAELLADGDLDSDDDEDGWGSGEEDSSDDEDEDGGGDEEESGGGGKARREGPFFPELVAEIAAAIARLGGAVFPKLNWSSPKDAAWIACDETLRCATPGDVLLLLKSSDFVAHDLCHAFDGCDVNPEGLERPASYHLVLRKWSNLHVSREFRCFAVDGRLVGVSQRDANNHYPDLFEDGGDTEGRLLGAIDDFFRDTVAGAFPLRRYVFDVYVDKAFRVWLVDFNPFGPSTDPKLFDYGEVVRAARAGAAPELRLVRTAGQIRPQPDHLHRLPRDVVDLGGNPGAMDDLIRRLKEREAAEAKVE